MQVSIGFQPNCSETVFRFSHKELDSLTPEQKAEFWKAAAQGVTPEDIESNAFRTLNLPSLEFCGVASSTTLEVESEDQFRLCYYQTSNEMLLEFAKATMKAWTVDAPFTREDDIPKDHNWDIVERDKKSRHQKFQGKQVQPKGWEAIIALGRVADQQNQANKEAKADDGQ